MMRELTKAEKITYAKVAKLKYGDVGNIEFDDEPIISFSPDEGEGAYVQAWVWVGVDELKNS